MFDTLLSMGGLSLLYASSNSWSTSFNLLFFYFTWTTLLLSHPPIKIELIGTIFVRVLFFWVPTLLFLLFDLSIPSLSRNLKLQGKRGVGQPALLRIKVLGWALVNMALGIAVQGAVEYLWVYVLGWKTALRIARTLPLPGELIWGVFRGIVVREILQYYIHRFVLHDTFASFHTSWQHSISAPWSVVAHYDHPLVNILSKTLTCYAPAVFFRFHLLTWFLFLAIVSVEEVMTFSGYRTVLSLLGGATRRVDKHYEERGKGNFATWGLVDWAHGTLAGAEEVEKGEAARKEA